MTSIDRAAFAELILARIEHHAAVEHNAKKLAAQARIDLLHDMYRATCQQVPWLDIAHAVARAEGVPAIHALRLVGSLRERLSAFLRDRGWESCNAKRRRA